VTITPVNFRKQDSSPEAVARDVDYALQIVDFYVRSTPGGGPRLLDESVLELGPGPSLGTAVLLACHGARVSVADRYLAAWDEDYHRPFYTALLGRLRAEHPDLSPDPILRVLEAAEFVEETVRGLPLGIEDLDAVSADRFDVVLSNAVFEHVENVPRAFRILARITKPGGAGVHQVDFRDHRDFDRPLEYLTIPSRAFQKLFLDVAGECGNRWRPGAMQIEAERADFDVLSFEGNMFADEAYLDDVLPRLAPEYAELSRESLRVLSGCFVLRRRAAQALEYPVDTDSAQTLAHSRARYGFAAQFAGGGRVLDVGCGAGLGTRMLSAAGARSVVGVDVRPEALAAAREADSAGEYREHDLERPLPFPDGAFDLVVCLEVLEHVRDQAGLAGELRRVLAADGVALVSVPNKAFEAFWNEMAGEENPYHVHVPDIEELVRLLDGFPWVEFLGQVDVVSSVVLPLDADESRASSASLQLPGGTSLSDRGTVSIVAVCRQRRPADGALRPPAAFAYGNYQDAFGSAMAHGQRLERSAEAAAWERFVAANKLRWTEVETDEAPPA